MVGGGVSKALGLLTILTIPLVKAMGAIMTSTTAGVAMSTTLLTSEVDRTIPELRGGRGGLRKVGGRFS